MEKNSKKIIKTNITLQTSDYYKIRTLYPNYDTIDYQIFGGMVIMPLCNNHLQLKNFQKNNIQKYNILEEKIKERLIIVKIIKGSRISENEIIYVPLILKEVNGLEVNNMADLRRILHLLKVQDNTKYFTFLTDNNKYFMLELNETKQEEDFLSKKFNYEISEYTHKLFASGDLNSNNLSPSDNLSSNNNTSSVSKDTIYNILSKKNNISPLAPLSPSLSPIISLTPIDSTAAPIISNENNNLTLLQPNSNSDNLSPVMTPNNLSPVMTPNNLSPVMTPNNNVSQSINNIFNLEKGDMILPPIKVDKENIKLEVTNLIQS